MPNWKTHLEIAKKINLKLNYKEKDLELFMLGNILPDINNGYGVKDVSVILSHDYTHYKGDDFYTYGNFSKYYDVKSNPLLYGYYIHLYSDFMFNNNFYSNLRDDVKNLSKDELRKLKQSDFKIYNNKYINNKLTINNYDLLVDTANKVDHVSITKDDLIKTVNYINNQSTYDDNYKYYNENELDLLLDKVVNDIVNNVYL